MPPISLLIKPASGRCNMCCRYCFYADETKRREVPDYGMMKEDVLHAILSKALSQAEGQASFMFQGGEPTLRGLPFFKEAVRFEREINTRRIPVNYALQTNGLLIDDEWCAFFKQENFLIGLSIDGTASVHNKNRVDFNNQGTLSRVMNAARLLQKHQVPFNVLTVVTDETAKKAGLIYDFLMENGLCWQQYIPCLDAFGEQNNYLTPEGYGQFLCTLFDRWYRDVSAGRFVFIRQFENWLGMLLGRPPEACGMGGMCTRQFALEADGSCYPCDFYVLDGYRLGNFLENSIEEIDAARESLGFVEGSRQKDEKCLACPYHPLCLGGCRRDRDDGKGQLSRTRFCLSYRMFFEHGLGRLEQLARNLAAKP